MNFIEQIILNMEIKKLKEGKVMGKILAWLQGKKTYTMLAISIITGILQSQGIVVPDFVWVALASLTGIAYKAGQNRAEQATQDLLDAIKQAKQNPQ